jgi:hypothetical protein
LRELSSELGRIRSLSDWTFLALEYGPEAVSVDVFFGSDFFLESQDEIFDLLEKSPNPIESKGLIIKLAKTRSMFNRERGERDVLLYKFLPYAYEKDFDKAIERGAVDSVNFSYQTRFDYWVNLFESEYGDILQFWNMMEDASDAEKFIVVNNLIINLIETNEREQEDPSPSETV